MASRAAAGTSLIDTIVSRSITDGITVDDIEFKGGQGENRVAEDGYSLREDVEFTFGVRCPLSRQPATTPCTIREV